MGIASNLVHAYAAKAKEESRETVTILDDEGEFEATREDFAKYGKSGIQRFNQLLKYQRQS